MNYYRLTLADGVMHYLFGNSARAVRRLFERNYPHLGVVASVRVQR